MAKYQAKLKVREAAFLVDIKDLFKLKKDKIDKCKADLKKNNPNGIKKPKASLWATESRKIQRAQTKFKNYKRSVKLREEVEGFRLERER